MRTPRRQAISSGLTRTPRTAPPAPVAPATCVGFAAGYPGTPDVPMVEFGVPDEQITVTAHGEAKPWKENELEDGTDNPEGRKHNRRAEIYLNF